MRSLACCVQAAPWSRQVRNACGLVAREVTQIVNPQALTANRFQRRGKRIANHLVGHVAAAANRREQKRCRVSANK